MPIFDDRNVMPMISEIINVVEAARFETERFEKNDPGLIDVPKFIGPVRLIK